MDSYEVVQHVVFRLHDALPPGHKGDADAVLDAGHGAALLRGPHAARIVVETLLHFDDARYRLHAWCVMPTHVHVLVETVAAHELGAVVRSWKAYSAARINRLLSRRGSLWARDYFDRYMRDGDHFEITRGYIEMNPVKAGLCAVAEDWPWSSAGWRESMR